MFRTKGEKKRVERKVVGIPFFFPPKGRESQLLYNNELHILFIKFGSLSLDLPKKHMYLICTEST